MVLVPPLFAAHCPSLKVAALRSDEPGRPNSSIGVNEFGTLGAMGSIGAGGRTARPARANRIGICFRMISSSPRTNRWGKIFVVESVVPAEETRSGGRNPALQGKNETSGWE